MAANLIEARRTKLKYLTWPDFERFMECIKAPAGELKNMVEFLTEVGICRYLEHSELVVLDEIWLTSTMAMIACNAESTENAILSEERLHKAWKTIKEELRPVLLKVLEENETLWPINNDRTLRSLYLSFFFLANHWF